MRRERLTVVMRLALAVALGSLVVAASGAAARTTLPRCAPDGYGLEQAPLPRMAQAQKTVRVTAGWLAGTERRRSCRLETTIRVGIAYSGRAPVTAQWTVSTVLTPWASVVHTWAWRNWSPADATGHVRITFTAPNGRPVHQLVPQPPTCMNADAPSTLEDVGTGTKYVKRPGDRIPPHILPGGHQSPLPPPVIHVRNGWIASDGYTLVAVYAGTAPNGPTVGRFAIVRQNLIFGVQFNPP